MRLKSDNAKQKLVARPALIDLWGLNETHVMQIWIRADSESLRDLPPSPRNMLQNDLNALNPEGVNA